jgi:hypothetical protein
MDPKIKTSDSAVGVLRKFNLAFGLNLFPILVLFIYLLCIKYHLFRDESYKRFEISVLALLFINMLFNYFLNIAIVKRLELTNFHRITRHVLYIGFLSWLILAISSSGGISINEISIVLFLFYLIELLITLQQTQKLLHPESKVQLKLLFIGGFILSSFQMYFFFLTDRMYLSIDLLFMIVFCGIYFSLVNP